MSRTLAVVLPLVGLAVAGAVAVSATDSSGQAATGTTLELQLPAKEAKVTLIDLPPVTTKARPSESPGDRVVMSGPLVDAAGKRLGWHYNEATVVKGRSPKTTEQSVTTFVLGAGQITAHGVFDQTGAAESLAVTGGTGAYQGASGEIAITGDDKAIRFTVRLR